MDRGNIYTTGHPLQTMNSGYPDADEEPSQEMTDEEHLKKWSKYAQKLNPL
jgi:hypothetical protein